MARATPERKLAASYLRSKSVQHAGFAGGVEADNTADAPVIELAAQTDYEECLACQ